jgi:hypothetical protein
MSSFEFIFINTLRAGQGRARQGWPVNSYKWLQVAMQLL